MDIIDNIGNIKRDLEKHLNGYKAYKHSEIFGNDFYQYSNNTYGPGVLNSKSDEKTYSAGAKNSFTKTNKEYKEKENAKIFDVKFNESSQTYEEDFFSQTINLLHALKSLNIASAKAIIFNPKNSVKRRAELIAQVKIYLEQILASTNDVGAMRQLSNLLTSIGAQEEAKIVSQKINDIERQQQIDIEKKQEEEQKEKQIFEALRMAQADKAPDKSYLPVESIIITIEHLVLARGLLEGLNKFLAYANNRIMENAVMGAILNIGLGLGNSIPELTEQDKEVLGNLGNIFGLTFDSLIQARAFVQDLFKYMEQDLTASLLSNGDKKGPVFSYKTPNSKVENEMFVVSDPYNKEFANATKQELRMAGFVSRILQERNYNQQRGIDRSSNYVDYVSREDRLFKPSSKEMFTDSIKRASENFLSAKKDGKEKDSVSIF